MEKNKISVIIPVYKVEKYLDKCVQSVVDQTYKNLEIILVDDGSPDNCPKMCDEWAKKDNRIKVIHKQNGGLSDARNVGVENSTGDYIMFLDSDDYVSTEICEKLMELALKHDVPLAACGYCLFPEDTNPAPCNEKVKEFYFQREGVINQIYHASFPCFVVAWGKLYKREIFDGIKYPVGKVHEDEHVIHEVLYNANSMVYTTEQLYYYLQRKSSITGQRKQNLVIDALQAFENRFNFLNEKLPERLNDNKLHYLQNLRVVYTYKYWATKELKKEIFNKFKSIYKTTANKSFRDIAFRFFPKLTARYVRIKYKNI